MIITNTIDRNMTQMTGIADNYGFPQGYFIIRSVAMRRLLDVREDESEDGTELILFPQKELSLLECTLFLYLLLSDEFRFMLMGFVVSRLVDEISIAQPGSE